jgi:hypothetical protein
MMNSPFGGHGQLPGQDRTRLDDLLEQHLADTLMTMQPRDNLVTTLGSDQQTNTPIGWALADPKRRHILAYVSGGAGLKFGDLPGAARYTGRWMNPVSGESQPAQMPARLGNASLTGPGGGFSLLYVQAD